MRPVFHTSRSWQTGTESTKQPPGLRHHRILDADARSAVGEIGSPCLEEGKKEGRAEERTGGRTDGRASQYGFVIETLSVHSGDSGTRTMEICEEKPQGEPLGCLGALQLLAKCRASTPAL
jgi:hypothetical protein